MLNDTHRLSRILFQLLHVSLCVDSISLLNLFILLLSLINVLYQGWYLQTKENLVFNIMHGKFWFDGDFFVLCSPARSSASTSRFHKLIFSLLDRMVLSFFFGPVSFFFLFFYHRLSFAFDFFMSK